MAAQEYFQGHIPGAPSQPPPPQQAPSTQPIRIQPPPLQQSPSLPLPYPLFDGPPPPYSPGGANNPDHRPHSQPPPQQRYTQPNAPSQHPEYRPSNLSQSYRPPAPTQSQSSYGYPPEKLYPQTQHYGLPRPGSQSNPAQPFDPQQRQQYPPQQNAWPSQTRPYSPAPAVQPPNLHPHPPRRKNSAASTEYPPSVYRPDPRDTKPSKPHRSRSRSRSRSRERRRHDRGTERNSGGKPKSSVNTFLGASGGALIGDAIFPGLGTIGGALLGGLGGHEYGKKDKKGRSTGREERERGGERERDGRRRRYSDEDDGRRGRR